jgi:hypothetical protein
MSITQSPPSSRFVYHIPPSLRLFIPNSLQVLMVIALQLYLLLPPEGHSSQVVPWQGASRSRCTIVTFSNSCGQNSWEWVALQLWLPYFLVWELAGSCIMPLHTLQLLTLRPPVWWFARETHKMSPWSPDVAPAGSTYIILAWSMTTVSLVQYKNSVMGQPSSDGAHFPLGPITTLGPLLQLSVTPYS